MVEGSKFKVKDSPSATLAAFFSCLGNVAARIEAAACRRD